MGQASKNLLCVRCPRNPFQLPHLFLVGILIQSICFRFWQLVVDPLAPQDAKSLEEHLGIERDTSEHAALEQGSLCQQKRKF